MSTVSPEPGESPDDGGSPDEAAAWPGADGLFGPDSVTWRIMGEPIVWVAGFRSLFLQALNPRAMRATWQNTSFTDRREAWGRFVRTAEFVGVRTYGTAAEAERAGRRVRKIHATLTGTDADGSIIRLDEPDLLLWVHCGEVASYVDIARRCGMPVSAADLDAFVSEQRRGGAMVGLDPASLPASVADLDAYYERVTPGLYACDEAKEALRGSFNPPVPTQYLALKVVIPPFSTLAFATLPRWARKMYGTPGSPLTDFAATAALRALYQSTTRVPRQLLYLPATAAMRLRGRGRGRPAPPAPANAA
ncbi:MAG: oxygenase MpaB family protein [Streptosporangiaceae bacterium]|jgi:uncharacterized protein (DUF2236 family)